MQHRALKRSFQLGALWLGDKMYLWNWHSTESGLRSAVLPQDIGARRQIVGDDARDVMQLVVWSFSLRPSFARKPRSSHLVGAISHNRLQTPCVRNSTSHLGELPAAHRVTRIVAALLVPSSSRAKTGAGVRRTLGASVLSASNGFEDV